MREECLYVCEFTLILKTVIITGIDIAFDCLKLTLYLSLNSEEIYKSLFSKLDIVPNSLKYYNSVFAALRVNICSTVVFPEGGAWKPENLTLFLLLNKKVDFPLLQLFGPVYPLFYFHF